MSTSGAVTFGRRGVEAKPLPVTSVSSGAGRPELEPELRAGRLRYPIEAFLDGLLLWLPNEDAPGFWAVCLSLLRQAVLPFFFVLGPVCAYMLLFRSVSLKALLPGAAPGSIKGLIPICIFGSIALVQELSRYAFVRRASNPTRSVALFAAVVVACMVIVYHDHPYTLAWMITAQLGASAAVIGVRTYWSWRALIVTVIVVCQTAISCIMPGVGPSAATPRAVAANSAAVQNSSSGAENASGSTASPPSVGGMQTFAKLYPDAVTYTQSTQHVLGLTQWNVQYGTRATQDQIASFYDDLAIRNGFTPEKVFLGLHAYKQGDASEFSYQTFTDDIGLRVVFMARSFPQR